MCANRGEPADVTEHDGGVARFPASGLDCLLRAGDLPSHLGREEAREVTRRLALGGGAHDQAPRPVHGHREHQGHDPDGDDLVRLRPDEDGIGGHVLDVVAGDHLAAAGSVDCVSGENPPAGGGGDPGRHHVAGPEAEDPESDEDEDVDHRRGLEIERRRLSVLDVERPDEGEEEGHVHHDGQVQEPRHEPLPPGEEEAHQGEERVPAKDGRHRVDGPGPARRGRLIGLDGGKEHEEQDDAELKQADEPLALDLLAPDCGLHPLGQPSLGLPIAPDAFEPVPDHRSASRVDPPREGTGG